MTATEEMWRVASETPTSPAHRILIEREGVRVTACNWVPRGGVLYTRTQMLLRCTFACTRCLRSVVR
jgi:hypothetical protein